MKKPPHYDIQSIFIALAGGICYTPYMNIQTERLIITEFTQAMARSHHINSLDVDNREYLPDEVFESVESARGNIAWLAGYYENADGPLVYPVLLRDGTHIGHVQACPIKEGWEIGFHTAAAHTGKGYATEAVRAFLPVVMERLAITQITGNVRADNPASRRVLEKCGFVLEDEGTSGWRRYRFAKKSTLYITDLDGTLLTPQARLSDFAIQTLPRLMRDGLHFTIATARTWQSSRIVLKDILPLSAPAVLLNGALIYDTQTDEYVQKAIIPKERVLALLDAMRAHGQTGFLYSIREGFIRPYHEDISGRPFLQTFMAARTGYYNFTSTPDLGLYADEEIVYLTMQDRLEALAPLREAVKALPEIACVLYEDSYTPGIWYLECCSHTATKGNAVRFLRERYGYDRIIGFGDNLNDIPLFKACDGTYAVANAKEELKAMATGVIGSNEEDGVVRFLMTPNITIRPATTDDAPACAEIHCRGWEAAYSDFIPAEAIAQKNAARPAAWPGYLASGKYDYYVPVLEGKVVGFLSLGQPSGHESLPDCYCELGGIYLHPSVYRQGIGRKLMAFAEDRARETGKTAMMLWVFEDNAPSRRFYEACGYRPDGAADTHEYGRTLRSLRYVKEL